MSPLNSFLERPRLRCGLGLRKARAVVCDIELEAVGVDRKVDVDTIGPAVANGIGDGFAKQLLKIQMEPDGNGGMLAVRRNPAHDGPLLTETLGKRA